MTTCRDSFGTLVGNLVDSFPLDVEGRTSISDFGKMLFNEGQSRGTTVPQQGLAGSGQSVLSKRVRAGDQDDKAGEVAQNFAASITEGQALDYQLNDSRPTAKVRIPDNEIKGVPRQKQSSQTFVDTDGVTKSSGRTKWKAPPNRWTADEDEALRTAVKTHGERTWKAIAEEVPGRNHTQCLQRWTKVLAPGLVKGHWRPEEDDLLRQFVAEGRKNWGQVAARIPGRTSKQCRERWYNHLDPNIIRGEYTPEEDRLIIEAQTRLGNRWSAISAMLPGRTEDAVKIRWKSLCRSRTKRNRSAHGLDKGAGGVEQKPSITQQFLQQLQAQQVQQQATLAAAGLFPTGQASLDQQDRIREQQQALHRQRVQLAKQEAHLHEMLKLEDQHTRRLHPVSHFDTRLQQPQVNQVFNPALNFARSLPPSSTGASPGMQSANSLNSPDSHVPLARSATQFTQEQNQRVPQHVEQPRQTQAVSVSQMNQPTNRPRNSIDAARAAAARRLGSKDSGTRGSLDGFLNDLGDMGRFSDMELEDLGGMDELWRVSDDMNRLSL